VASVMEQETNTKFWLETTMKNATWKVGKDIGG
jgi:hypothetical protein